MRWSNEAKASVVNAFHEKGHPAAIKVMFELNEKYAPGDCFMSAGIKMVRYLHLKEDEPPTARELIPGFKLIYMAEDLILHPIADQAKTNIP